MKQSTDVIVLGSGIGGSLMAAILAQAGRTVALVDRHSHPRFAIGESSTPLADSYLKTIGEQFGLPELLPLTSYGSWKNTYPEIGCGIKRGFSYFGHSAGEPFDEAKQLLVTASSNNDISDTHWLRSDVDQFLFRLAEQRGAITYSNADYRISQVGDGWKVVGTANDIEFRQDAPFVIDATGASGEVLNAVKAGHASIQMRDRTSCCFGHFENLPTVEALLRSAGVDVSVHPFPCDLAAVHHVCENGWMWQLRFDDETVSAGFMTYHASGMPAVQSSTSKNRMLGIPADSMLSQQMQYGTCVRPEDGIQFRMGIARLRSIGAGKNWAALPSSVGFIDPLHSTGIAHTLSGVLRLAEMLLNEARESSLQAYSNDVVSELQLVDDLVEGCYASLPSFRLWCDWAMIYFAAATSMEQSGPVGGSFLRSDDVEFRRFIRAARIRLQDAINSDGDKSTEEEFEAWLKSAIEPWNHVGLLTRPDGMYADTAAR